MECAVCMCVCEGKRKLRKSFKTRKLKFHKTCGYIECTNSVPFNIGCFAFWAHIYSALNFSLRLLLQPSRLTTHAHTHTSTSCAWFFGTSGYLRYFLVSHTHHTYMALVSFSDTIRCQCGMVWYVACQWKERKKRVVKWNHIRHNNNINSGSNSVEVKTRT